jgi:hypothetical protein
MAESKNIFIKSKMNKDLDDRLLQQGEYRNAVNIQVSKSESEDVGALENILGNAQKISTGDQEAIVGYLVSELNSAVYLFLTENKISINPNGDYNPAAMSRIIECVWNGSSFSSITTLVTGAFLNFWEGSPMGGVNLLESLLFFTDNRNQPRVINIDTARANEGYYATEDDISVAKFAPYEAPILYQESLQSPGNYEATMKDVVSEFLPDGTTANPYYNSAYQGDPDYLEDKFVRFGYRFQYDNNEYSVFSPFTQECFIPKQDGYFLEGDEQQTVASTVVSFLENKVNEIKLRIPLPSCQDPALPTTTINNFTSQFKVKKIEILYKESDEIRVLVVDTLTVSDIANQWIPFNLSNAGTGYSIAENVATTTTGSGNGLTVDIQNVDIVTGEILSLSVNNAGQDYQEGDIVTISTGNSDATITIGSLNILEYTYSGTKPFKTLPEAQTVRVYDKVPIKAKTQEVISNRVVYGNFQTKHSPPSNLNYNLGSTEKQPFSLGNSNVDKSTAIVEYPNHSLKQNRNYQAGFVFADRFGRATSTVLANQGVVSASSASQLSTVYSPYNDTNVDIPAWPGDTLVVQVNTEIDATPNPSSDPFYPGVYNGDPSSVDYNPLGLYSWKIVVKQQEQDYYTVYLPSAMKGEPFFEGTPSATEPPDQNASFVTVINDNINKIPRDLKEVGPQDKSFRSSVVLYGRVENTDSAFTNIGNKQYYPFRRSFTTNVIEDLFDIFDVADYSGTSGNIPVTSDTNPYYAFFRSESNPFVAEFITSQTTAYQFGIINLEGSSSNPPNYVKFENLTILETDPVESRLDIYWETSTSGTIADLNEYVANTGSTTIFALNGFQFSFNESYGIYTGNPSNPEPGTGGLDRDRSVIAGPFFFENVSQQPIQKISLHSFSASNSNGVIASQQGENAPSAGSQFRCLRIVGTANGGTGTYTDYQGNSVTDPSTGLAYAYDTFIIVSEQYIYWDLQDNIAGLQTYSFSIEVEDTTPNSPGNGINVTKIQAANQLGNIATEINDPPTSPLIIEYGYSQFSPAPFGVFKGTNGAYFNETLLPSGQTVNNQNGLVWTLEEVRDASGTVVTGIFNLITDTSLAPPAVFGIPREVNYGTAIGQYELDILLQGPDGTSDTFTFQLTIGEKTADGSFSSQGSPILLFDTNREQAEWMRGGTWLGSFHNSSANFNSNNPATFYPSSAGYTINSGIVYANSCNSSGGSGTPPSLPKQYLWTQRASTSGSTGGNYGLSQGTGYIKIVFQISPTPTSPEYNSFQYYEIAQAITLEYRPNSSSSWVAARDIEGNNLSNISGTANRLSRRFHEAEYGNITFENQRYGCFVGYGFTGESTNSAEVWVQNSSTNMSTVRVAYNIAIGDSPIYKDILGGSGGTGLGEYRLTVGYANGFTLCGTAPTTTTSPTGSPTTDLTNELRDAYMQVYAGDFYYDFGFNRAFAYEMNTSYESNNSADVFANSTLASDFNQVVYAREPFPQYVSQFYTDIGLTNPLNLGNSTTGPKYMAYKAKQFPAAGSSRVGNVSSSASAAVSDALENAASYTSGTISSGENQWNRVWAAQFVKNTSQPDGLISYKNPGTATPKNG